MSNETDEENADKPITISIPVNEKMKSKGKPVQIPVRHSAESSKIYNFELKKQQNFVCQLTLDANYSDDFNESEQSNSKVRPRSKSPSETSSTSTEKSTKTWQILFHTSNIPTASLNLTKKSSKNAHLTFSFVGFDPQEQTEEHRIDLSENSQCFKSGKQDSFKDKFTDIGQPKQIKLKFEINQQDKQDVKWHLDHVNSYFFRFLLFENSRI